MTMSNILMFIGTQQLLLIMLIVLVLFGGKKIPELMSSLGKGVKSFKDGMNATGDATNDAKEAVEKTKDE